MSEIGPMSDDQRSEWAAWVASRPDKVRLVAERFFPNRLYRLKSSGHRVTLYSFGEPEDDGPVTLTVSVSGDFNLVAFERRVFGIRPEDLEECDLPAADELVGSADMDVADFRVEMMKDRPS